MRSFNLSLTLLESISLDTIVLDHGAVMTHHSNMLAKKGDFVCFSGEKVGLYHIIDSVIMS